MSSPQIERKLAAIMFTDIVGYTESMSKSESKTLNLLEKKRSILKPLLKEYKGTFVKEIGDGTLSYFESAVNAATCAVKLQETTYDDKDMNIRVGIHIGDIVFKDGDVFGGGVNVASRLESIAPAGGVCVSKSVYDELSNQENFDGVELGLQSLKGVGRLVEVFALKGEKLNEPNPNDYKDNCCPCCDSNKEVPSIAIIPFRNKGKKKDEFYAYGICTELISDCSGAGLIRVASLEQVEELGDITVKDKAKKLDVRYIANGTLWRMDDMFQLSIELYDSKESKVIWSDNWQENWDNLPTIKGSLSNGILKVLDVKPKYGNKIDTNNTEAYEYYLKAIFEWDNRKSRANIDASIGLIKKAIELDNNLLVAKNFLATRYIKEGDKALSLFKNNIKQANLVGDENGYAASLKGIGQYYRKQKKYAEAREYYNNALEIFIKHDNKYEIAHIYDLIGHLYEEQREFTNTHIFWQKSKEIHQEIENIDGVSTAITHSGFLHLYTGNYIRALAYFEEYLQIQENINNNIGKKIALQNIGCAYLGIGEIDAAYKNMYKASKYAEQFSDKDDLHNIYELLGIILINKMEYKTSIEHLEKANDLVKDCLITNTHLSLSYAAIGKEYNKKEINILIKESESIDFDLNYPLYQLLEDTSYLETSYNQVQELAGNLEPDVAAKFLSYPIPKAIVEEWEKVN